MTSTFMWVFFQLCNEAFAHIVQGLKGMKFLIKASEMQLQTQHFPVFFCSLLSLPNPFLL